MKWRKVIGWLLLPLGILILFVMPVISKEITGDYNRSLAILISFLTIGSGWILAHPKKRSE